MCFPALLDRGVIPDVVTDQTSAHDPLKWLRGVRVSLEQAAVARKETPDRYLEDVYKSIAVHVRAMLELKKRGAVTFDYGNNIRQVARDHGVADAFDFPGFVPAFIRPLFCEGKGPFRWAALSGDPNDIAAIDEAVLEAFPEGRVVGTVDRAGAGEGCVPGASGAHLLAGLRRAAQARVDHERPSDVRAAYPPRLSSGGTTSMQAAWLRQTARRRRCATGLMRWRTGWR